MTERELKVIEFLKGKDWVLTKDIKEGTGLGEKSLRKALTSLVTQEKVEVKEEKKGAITYRWYKLKVKEAVSEAKGEVKKVEEKPSQNKTLIVKVNDIKVLEVENVIDPEKEFQDIVKLYFQNNVEYDTKEEGENFIVNVKMRFGTKG